MNGHNHTVYYCMICLCIRVVIPLVLTAVLVHILKRVGSLTGRATDS